MSRALPLLLIATLLPGAAFAADPLARAHAKKDGGHVMEVVRYDSAIENLNAGTVQVFGMRKSYRCPTGELVAETKCDPCEKRLEEWAERPTGRWLYEMEFETGNPDDQALAAGRAQHYEKHFELEKRSGAEKGGRSITFYEYLGRLKAPPEPDKAMRVQFFLDDEPATAGVLPAEKRELLVEARAEKKGETGSLVPFPEATLAFAADCGEVRQTSRSKALVSLKAGVDRCAFKVTAKPGDATATLVVLRETQVQITYEGQPADDVVLDGSSEVDLAFECSHQGHPADCIPEWKSESGSFGIKEGGKKVKFTLDPKSPRASVVLTDRRSGASDILTVRRK